MPRKGAKSRQKPPKRRRLYIPNPVTGRVAVRHIVSQSNRQIAREEGIDRGTVHRILGQEEVATLMVRYQAGLLQMLPKVSRVLDKALDSPDLRVALAAAGKLMPAVKEVSGGEYESNINRAGKVHTSEFELFLAKAGDYMKHIWYDYRFGGVPLPEPFRWMEEALSPTVEQAATSADRSEES
jgi:hypothetical protein